MGGTALFFALWTVASVLAVGCWNVVKYVVTRSHEPTVTQSPVIQRAPQPVRMVPMVIRQSVDAM